MSSSIEITPELMAGFLDEAPEYLDMLDVGLMELESKAGSGVLSLDDPDDQEQMNVMFRAAHSLKGLAAAFGFENIKELTHRMETLFDQVRMGKRDLTNQSFETLFNVFDRLKSLVQELTDENAQPVLIEDLLQALDSILEDTPGASASEPDIENQPENFDDLVNQAFKAADSTTEQVPEVEPVAEAAPDLSAEVSDNIQQPESPAETTTAAPPETQSASSPLNNELFDDPELVALFVETTVETVDELNQGLLGLEENPSEPELLNTVFRCAHNIKGASGAAGLSGMNRLTHEMETVFDHLRSHRVTLNEELMNAIFQAVDRLRVTIDQIREGQPADIADHEMRDHFKKWIEQGSVSAKLPAVDKQVQPVKEQQIQPAANAEEQQKEEVIGIGDGINMIDNQITGNDGEKKICVTVTFAPGFNESSIQCYLIHNKLSELGTMVSTNPDIDTITGDTDLSQIDYLLLTDVDPLEIERIVGMYDADRVMVTQADESSTHETTEAVTQSQTASPATSSSETAPAVIREAVETSVDNKVASSVPVAAAAPAAAAATPATVNTSSPPPITTKTSASSEKTANRKETPSKKTGETLRVDQERLDQLMNLGGELVINRSRFVQIHGKFREVFDGKNLGFLVEDMTYRMDQLGTMVDSIEATNTNTRLIEDFHNHILHLSQSFNTVRSLIHHVHELRASMFDFDEALHGLSRVSDSLQKGIMSTRMISIGPLFSRFRRVIRDISKSTGKKVELVLHGDTTELDKRMVDELGDPLTHMVRNSVDHGIELPEVREAAGKNPVGQVILKASHRGNSICIEVIDDGAGLNLERIKNKIIERELATSTQVSGMTDYELYQYVFRPGFSTAQEVTDLSGRGMGMDIVVSKIENLNGTVEVDSTPGQGTHVTIKLPLTLAILTSLIAKIGRGVYALPLETVAEIITVRREEIQWIQKRPVVCVRDRVIPIVFYEDIFDTRAENLLTESRNNKELTLVIVGFEKDKMGIVVDELLGQDDIVIKSIAENYENVRGIAGASIRGDGSVSLILDVSAMMEMASTMTSQDRPAPKNPVTTKMPELVTVEG